MNILNPFPHVSTYKPRALRRVVMVLLLPVDVVMAPLRAWYDTFYGFAYWWRQP